MKDNLGFALSAGMKVGDFGMKFIRNAEKNAYGNQLAWFTCKCGGLTKARIDLIKSGHTKTCGCSRKVPYRAKQIKKYSLIGNSGMRYIEDISMHASNRKIRYECHCGNISTGNLYQIRNGQVRSCGCISRSRNKAKQIRNKPLPKLRTETKFANSVLTRAFI